MRLVIFSCLLTISAIVIRGTLPRYRTDQALTLHWKFVTLFFLIFYLVTLVETYLFSM